MDEYLREGGSSSWPAESARSSPGLSCWCWLYSSAPFLPGRAVWGRLEWADDADDIGDAISPSWHCLQSVILLFVLQL